MKTTLGRKTKKETGLRLYGDQIENLDVLVGLSRGRRKRSQLISDAIDEYLAGRLALLSRSPV